MNRRKMIEFTIVGALVLIVCFSAIYMGAIIKDKAEAISRERFEILIDEAIPLSAPPKSEDEDKKP